MSKQREFKLEHVLSVYSGITCTDMMASDLNAVVGFVLDANMSIDWMLSQLDVVRPILREQHPFIDAASALVNEMYDYNTPEFQAYMTALRADHGDTLTLTQVGGFSKPDEAAWQEHIARYAKDATVIRFDGGDDAGSDDD